MAPDSVTEVFNKGHNEARALYEEGKLDEAAEKADQLLDDEGIAHSYTKGEHLLTAARDFSVSSHQMLHAHCGMSG